MAKVEIRGAQYPLEKVFCDDFAFSIPKYQRPYAWTTEQAGELLDDLLGFMGDDFQPVDNMNPYFLGSIVLVKGDGPDAQIIDGQQRLTTLTILLAALRAVLPSDEAQDLTRYLYEKGSRITLVPDRYRLQLRERDAEFFQNFIQREGAITRLTDVNADELSDSQRNVLEIAILYMERLEALDLHLRVRLAQFILTRCLLVVVSTPELDSAYRIFTVLNNRGLDLSAADILKAEILGGVPSDAREDYTAKWEDLEESLRRRGFESLINHVRVAYRRGTGKESVLKEFRDYVLSSAPTSQALIDDILLPLGNAFYTVRHANYQNTQNAGATQEVNRLLLWLNQIENSDWVPPAILCLSRYPNQPDKLKRFLADLERVAVCFMIRGIDTNQRLTRYGRVLAAMHSDKDLHAPDSPLQLTHDEREDVLKRLDGDIYHRAPRTRQYILLRLDNELGGGGARYVTDELTVEHVLPQAPANGSVWLQWFSNKKDREKWRHRIANLVLLSRAKNSRASNYDFAQKKKVYFAGEDGASPFALTSQVLLEQKWTPEVVERRQQDLINRLQRLWRL